MTFTGWFTKELESTQGTLVESLSGGFPLHLLGDIQVQAGPGSGHLIYLAVGVPAHHREVQLGDF